MFKRFYLPAAFLLLLSGCDVFNIDGEQLIYPSEIEPLAMNELVERNREFQELNENICSTLNEFGYTGFSDVLFEGMESPCVGFNVPRVELSEPDTLLTVAIESLIFNREYTGVRDEDELALFQREPLFGCIVCEGPGIDSKPLQWKFVFERQTIQGKQIHGTYITVVVDANGVNRIWGNWYQDFYIPQRPNFLQDEIVNVLDGQTIEWAEPDTTYTHTISADQVELPGRQMIVPFEDQKKLQMRVGWIIEIPSDEVDFGGWKVVGDILEGRIILVDKLIGNNDFSVQ